MSHEKLTIPTAGVELVRKLAAEGDRIFSTDRARQLAPAVGLSQGYLRQALHHLARSGWLIRLRKGLYVISSAMPGTSPVHEFEIAMALVSPAAISHWSAMHFHGLTDQAPRKVFVLTTTVASVPRRPTSNVRRREEGYRVGNTLYKFVQTKPDWYFGTEKVWSGEARVTITDPERTLVDGLSMPQHCGDLAEVLHAFRTRGEQLDVEKIVGYALRLDAATAKRLGWVLQELGFTGQQLDALRAVPVKGYRRLDPTGPRRGCCNRCWMIQENLPGKAKP